MFAVRTRISESVNSARALAAAALIPAIASGAENQLPERAEQDLSALSVPTGAIGFPRDYGTGTAPYYRVSTILPQRPEFSSSYTVPQQIFFSNLGTPTFRTTAEIAREAEEIPAIIDRVAAAADRFRSTHPGFSGTLITQSFAPWRTSSQSILESVAAQNFSEADRGIPKLRGPLEHFERALLSYDATLKQFPATAHRYRTNEVAYAELDPKGARTITERIGQAQKLLSVGDSKYYEAVRDVELDIASAEQSLLQAEQRRQFRNLMLFYTGILAAFGVSIGAGIKYFGGPQFGALLSAARPLLFSRRLSMRDRIAFFSIARNAVKLSGFLESTEPKLGRRVGKFVAGLTGMLHRQKEPGGISRLERMISHEPIRSQRELHGLVADLLADPLVIKMLWPGKDPAEAKRIEEEFKKIARPDGPPCRMEDELHNSTPEAHRFYAETVEVMRRSTQLYRGFSALAFEAKGLSTAPPLLARFLYDVASEGGPPVGRLNAATPIQFPGPGIVSPGTSLTRLFGDPQPGETIADVLSPWKKAWPWAVRAIEEIEREEVIFSQMAYIATYKGEGPGYAINGIRYSYVVFNEHLPGTRTHGAYLVPSRAIESQFRDSVIPLADYVGSDPRFKLPAATSQQDFLQSCREYGPILHLTSNSNFGGSLVNSYAPDSHPHHRWEWERYPDGGSRDAWGHVHKTMMRGEYEHQWNSRLAEAFEPLAAAHHAAYGVATRYQNNLDVRRLRYGDWKKGYIPRRWGSEFDSASEERWSRDREDDGSLRMNPGRFMMLDEVCLWHLQGRRDTVPKERLPVLSLGKIFNYFDAPDRSLLLDSWDLSFRFNGTLVLHGLPRGAELSADALKAHRAELERLWVEFRLDNLPPAADLRLYHRGSVVR